MLVKISGLIHFFFRGGGGGAGVLVPEERDQIFVTCKSSYRCQSLPSCFEPHNESKAKCKDFIMKIIFHSYRNKTNFHMKSFACSLAFIMRFKATWKWPFEKCW